MSNISNDPIDDVAPGDLITVDREGAGAQPCKVVHKETVEDGYLLTLEAPDAQTFDMRFASGATVIRSLQSKWESGQSPTQHRPPTA